MRSRLLLAAALLALTAAALAAPKPVVGIYYFDGWADRSGENFHLKDMPQEYPEREPLTGWYDDTAELVHQQVKAARGAGADFFLFDWYDTSRGNNAHERRSLNSAIGFFKADRNKLGMRYAMLYVNNGAFSVPQDQWDAMCDRWVMDYFTDKAYFRVAGKPLLVVFSVGDMEATWGGTAAGVAGAWERLRAAARKAGLPGVYVVACATPGPRNGWNDLARLSQEGYDAYSGYNYPGVPGTKKGSNPYSLLVKGSFDIFDAFAADGRKPYIPVVTDGWDSRPWNETDFWYERTPEEFGAFVTKSFDWWREHPNMHVLKDRPFILVEAWNELGEGSYIIPTKGDQGRYLEELKKAIAREQAGGGR